MKRADILAIASLFLTAVLFWLVPFFFSSEDSHLQIVTDSATHVYELDKPQTLNLKENGYELTVVIENGSVKVIKSTCQDQLCVHSAQISKTGQSVLCAPAHVLLLIVRKEASYDGIAH